MIGNGADAFGHFGERHALDINLCLAAELYPLRSACTAAAKQEPPMRVFRRWLLRFESGRGANSGSISSVYREYTAARVLRLFLREIQLTNPTAVIAGSCPAWKFLESIKEDT